MLARILFECIAKKSSHCSLYEESRFEIMLRWATTGAVPDNNSVDAVLALSSGNHGLECWLAHAWRTLGQDVLLRSTRQTAYLMKGTLYVDLGNKDGKQWYFTDILTLNLKVLYS